jgi:heat shock protein 1/8
MWHPESNSSDSEEYEERTMVMPGDVGWEAQHAELREAEKITQALWSYCFMAKTTLQEEKLRDKFEAGDKEKIEKAAKDVLDWLEKAQRREVRGGKMELEAKQKELEDVINPIMMKVICLLPYRAW